MEKGTNIEAESAGKTDIKKVGFKWKLSFAVILVLLCLWCAYRTFICQDMQQTIVYLDTEMSPDSDSAVRIVVRDRKTGNALENAEVRISLTRKNDETELGKFKTDARGSVDGRIRIPAIKPGDYELVVETSSWLGYDRVANKVHMGAPARIFLSSDKPIYQPGQVILFKSLICNSQNLKPLPGEKITFEISDPKGNKVYRKELNSSKFGITAGEFELASLVNTGRYKLKAECNGSTSEKTVEVKHYVLPKFKITASSDKNYYRPGEKVNCDIEAVYFFGKPAGGAQVAAIARTLQEKPVDIGKAKGMTDSSGRLSFQIQLPGNFTGMPVKQGNAFLELEISVTDTASHTEKRTLSLTVSENEIEVIAFPEGGTLVKGLENQVYVATAYPDGSPADCELRINGNRFKTGENGFAVIKLTPKNEDSGFEIIASDKKGLRGKLSLAAPGFMSPSFIFRPDKASYRVGETARLSILAEPTVREVFIDVVKNGQTLLTRSVEIRNGRGEQLIPVSADFSGLLQVDAYVIGLKGEDRGLSRMLYVNAASGLRISAVPDSKIYTPGGTAKIQVEVTDPDGKAVQAALGAAAVDESVFHVEDGEPGFLKQIFELNKSLLEPRYQIKIFASPLKLLSNPKADQDMASTCLLMAASSQNNNINGTLEKLVEQGYISEDFIKRSKDLKNSLTADPRTFISDPDQLRMLEILEGKNSKYKINTAPIKEVLEKKRKDALMNILGVCLAVSPFLVFVGIAIYNSKKMKRKAIGPSHGRIISEEARLLIDLYEKLKWNLTIQFILCMLSYPFLGIALSQINLDGKLIIVVISAFNAFVLAALSIPIINIVSALKIEARFMDCRNELITCAIAYIIQFAVFQILLVLIVLEILPANNFYFSFFLLIGSFVAPLIVMSFIDKGKSELSTMLGFPAKEETSGVSLLLQVLVVIAVLAILAGMMLPALSQAREKSRRISLSSDLKQIGLAMNMAEQEGMKFPSDKTGSSGAPARVRSWFPETLFWNPEIITDARGRAEIEMPLADSITTWRVDFDAIGSDGKLGGAGIPIKVFQDFFADLDLPVSLALGDRISTPVVCYNYLDSPQTIRLELEAADWFEAADDAGLTRTVVLQPNEVKAVGFPIKVMKIGNRKLLLRAIGQKESDAIEREIRILPTGRRIEEASNDVLRGNSSFSLQIPENIIQGSEGLVLKLYPSRFSEVVEGMNSIFRMPYGCFEQTSSVTYPNVLALRYMKESKRISPETEMKARKFIDTGYQRLLTFEVSGGGFDWYGHAPANISLSAYAILEFNDMAQVRYVDPLIIKRTKDWLYSKQKSDGSWNEERPAYTWGNIQSITAYIAWALAESGERSSQLEKALEYLRAEKGRTNNYGKALIANALLACNANDPAGRIYAEELANSAVPAGKGICWNSSGRSMTYSRGSGYDVETTALTTLALIKDGRFPTKVADALRWISAQKCSGGGWDSTQATILALRALLDGSGSARNNYAAAVTVKVNGLDVKKLDITKENNDVMRLLDLGKYLRQGANQVELQQEPEGDLAYQIAGSYWMPDDLKQSPSAMKQEMSINVDFDRRDLAVNDTLEAKVSVCNNTDKQIMMVIVDLGIPAGFSVEKDSFEKLLELGMIAKYEITGSQIIIYFRELQPQSPLRFSYFLKAKYPLKVKAPSAKIYEYYNQANHANSESTTITVK
ncbi:MAG: hypothetical protein A2X48_04770 [Lentisphaerae bacterium GWF2_49_21]|nr:MAG: hypothetical protein A2X48_04770 [Lentisphaerae bacterium GWF2_49_21]